MLGIYAKSFMTATRARGWDHWQDGTRFDTRKEAELAAHRVGRRRD